MITMIEYLPTTSDNPYDPFDEFDEWLAYDNQHGYGTLQILSRLAETSEDYSDEENTKITNEAVEKMVSSPFFVTYVKVSKET